MKSPRKFSARVKSEPHAQEVPAAALLISSGFPGIQYTVVDPNDHFQKYLILKVQALSGIDPLSPTSFNPILSSDGLFLKIDVHCSSVLSDADLLVHSNNAWMKDGSEYEADCSTRLSGLGPAIADLMKYCNGNPVMAWSLPLAHKCIAIVGNFSITNFGAEKNEYNKKYRPVILEFKLKLEEQAVSSMTKIKTSVWDSDSENDDPGNCKKS